MKNIKDFRTFLLGFLAIIASGLIATGQLILENVNANLIQLFLLFMSELFALILFLNLWTNPIKINKKVSLHKILFYLFDDISLICLISMVSLFYLFFLTFISTNIFTQTIMALTLSLFMITISISFFNERNFRRMSMILIVFIMLSIIVQYFYFVFLNSFK